MLRRGERDGDAGARVSGMARKRRGLRGISGGRAKRRGREVEWVGGHRESPVLITNRDPPWHPWVVFWLELPSGKILYHDLLPPDQAEGAVAAGLRQLIADLPSSAKRRLPDRIRVETDRIAREVRAIAGSGVEIVVAPSPELDELLADLNERLTPEMPDQSYLEGGVSPETVEHLFRAAQMFRAASPWKVARPEQVVRVDLPALDIEGACLSIVGRGHSAPGFLLFPSWEALETFAQADERPRRPDGMIDFGTPWLSFELQPIHALPPTMRREIEEHGWQPAHEDLCPVIRSIGRDAMPNPPDAREAEILWRCALGLSTFVLRHGSVFDKRATEPVSVSIRDTKGVRIRFTVPYHAYDEFEDVPAKTSADDDPYRGVGRNDPCPCGSGRKFEKCHQPRCQEAQRHQARIQRYRGLDTDILRALFEYMDQELGPKAIERIFKLATTPERAPGTAYTWLIYDALFDGRTVADRFAGRLAAPLREWAAAQQRAWFSVWEVVEIDPGCGFVLEDLLSGERRTIVEPDGARKLFRRDAMLCRVVDYRGLSVVCGLYGTVLPPREAAGIVERALKRLRRRKPVPVECLRDEDFTRYLIRAWNRAAIRQETRQRNRPALTNRDGDPLLFTTDHFDIARGAQREVERRLEALPDVEPPSDPDRKDGWTFLGPTGKTNAAGDEDRLLLGVVRIEGSRMAVETNSVARADALRRRIEEACGSLVRHRAREHADPIASLFGRQGRGGAAPAGTPPPDADEQALELKRRHYAKWIDLPLPALDGKTPREASRTKTGRRKLDVLLKEMEWSEQQLSSPPYDFSEIRRQLHLD
ncbi:MAG: hypothetical protein D6718_13405 [Acidobacteria bacterium]|nr:MAG: hypothetical protein D6718_13405 [Acidobacteriota bacterium]